MELSVTRRQLEFIRSTARETLFGGAAGGGKSYAQLIDALLFAMKYPASRQLILRRTFPELKRSLIQVSLTLYPKEWGTYGESNHLWTFRNKSLIEFGFCDSENDVTKYQSAEYDVIRFDELTHFTEFQFTYLLSRIRGTNGYPKQVKASTNPGGVGHSWVKSRYIDVLTPGEEKDGKLFLPAKVQDNTFLMRSDPEYVERLKLLDARSKKALLYGRWDLFEGQYFEEFSRDLHVVEPFEIPSSYRRFVAFDYGLDMLACLWFAVSPDGWIYVYRELHQPGLIVSEAAKKILEYSCGEEPEELYMPPDMASRQKDSGRTMAELFYENGISGKAADNRRVAGWLAVKELLKPVSDPYGGKTPRLRIFKNCTTLIAHLPALVRDEKNGSDASSHPHEITHICDALRYFALSYREKEPPAPALSPLEEAKRKALKRAKTGSRRSAF